MVKFNKILTSFLVSSLYLVSCKPTDPCNDIENFLAKKNIAVKYCSLEEEDPSKIRFLNFGTGTLTQEVVNKFAPLISTKAFGKVEIDGITSFSKNLSFESLNFERLVLNTKEKSNVYIPKNVLKTIKNVPILSIEGFNVSQRNINDVSTLGKLSELVFSGCTFDDNIDYTSIKNLKNLNELYFNSSFKGAKKFNQFPEAVCQLKNLKVLSFYEDELTAIPSCIKNLKSLEEFDLTDSKIKTLPKEIGYLTKLKIFHLDNNQLSVIPAEFGKLASLSELHLQGNKISTLPDEFANLKNLKLLSLYNNRIGSIPAVIGNLKNLEYLELSKNKVYRIPSCISKLSNLRDLYLNNNQIKVIPDHVRKLKNLRSLGLSHNLLTELPESLGQLKKLGFIDVVGNNIDPVTVPQSLKDLPDLEIAFEEEDY